MQQYRSSTCLKQRVFGAPGFLTPFLADAIFSQYLVSRTTEVKTAEPIMGNAIAKKFNLPKEHTATAGHVNQWKVWPGKTKDKGQAVSIWAFDKTDLSARKLNPVADKGLVEQVFQIMKRDLGVMKDSKACSNIIQIIEVNLASSTPSFPYTLFPPVLFCPKNNHLSNLFVLKRLWKNQKLQLRLLRNGLYALSQIL
jgi:hypothetical protein